MARRLNDTAAIARRARPSDPLLENESATTNVRKISNGYIRSESRSGPDGYSSSETYHQNKPDLQSGHPDAPEKRENSLRRAVDHMRSRD